MGNRQQSRLVLICRPAQKRYFKQNLHAIIVFACLLLLSMPFSYAEHTDRLALPAELFAEKDWSACMLECRRILIAEPNNNAIRLLYASAGARLPHGLTDELDLLVKSKHVSMATRHAAEMDLARLLWKKGSTIDAFEHFTAVFIETNSSDMFKRAGCSLAILLEQNKKLAKSHTYIEPQLKSCSSLWSSALIADCAPDNSSDKSSWTGKPAKWIISFYQAQIAPAIGERCSLSPSCSAYAMQALRKHGALGLAMYADRAVREPDVIQNCKNPVIIDNRRKYRDTVDEHDYWLTSP